eukprot:15295156-Alexandrium_andersonii.AAC.1
MGSAIATTSSGQPWTAGWSSLPGLRRSGSWSPGMCGASGRSPSASLARESGPSAAGGRATIRGTRRRR